MYVQDYLSKFSSAQRKEMATDRLKRLTALTPRRFHITTNSPYGVGLVLCGHVNDEEIDDIGSQFFTQRDGIKNCKPGIWTSMAREVGEPGDNFSLECILRWVAPGTINMAQSVEKWEEYEKETREKDLEVRMSEIVPKGTKWRRAGSYYDDGGVCSVISTEYLTMDAAKKIMFGTGEEEEEVNFGFYTETLTLNGWEMGAGENERFTIGGMNCKFVYSDISNKVFEIRI
jgi:hypothetical protein